MPQHEKLDYVEFPARDLKAAQAFFNSVFGRQFEDFGSDYCAFSGQGLDGGFYRSELYSSTQSGSALLGCSTATIRKRPWLLSNRLVGAL